MTVRLAVLLLEGSLVKLLQAVITDKVLRMELALHGCDTAACDWLVTPGTEGAPYSMVVDLTVGDAVVIKEITLVERYSAV